MKKKSTIVTATERLTIDLEQLAQDHPSFMKEVRGIARNYRDEMRSNYCTDVFMKYYKQYSIVKKKIENKERDNPDNYHLWDNRSRN